MKQFYRSISVVLTWAIISFGVMMHSSQLRAQVNFNTTLIGQLKYEERASDIWGYVDDSTGIEYAIIALLTGVSIIDVSTDPSNPTEVAFVPGPSSIWRDIKTHSHYAYVINEKGEGLQIIDLNEPGNAFEVAIDTTIFKTAHSIFIDAGFAYVSGADAANGGIIIFDLADPEAPLLRGTWDTAYIHDIYVRDDIVYAAAIKEDGSIYILDVKKKVAITEIGHFNYPDGLSHNIGLSDDGQYLFTTDEYSGAPLLVWDISDLTNVSQVGEYRALSNTIIHNVFIKGTFAFISYYVNGLKIVDLTDLTLPVEVGFYDTFLGSDDAGYKGNWGIYPYAPSGNLYLSDIDSGFYLVSFDDARAGNIEGFVYDGLTGKVVPGANIHFEEANKSIRSKPDGKYSFHSAEGEHQIITTLPGYFDSDNPSVTIVAGETTVFDITLQPFISISENLISMSMEVGQSDSVTFEITNVALDSIAFNIRDINGQAEASQGAVKSGSFAGGALTNLFSNVDWSKPEYVSKDISDPTSAAVTFKEIISDPAGDMLFGTAPDAISVEVEQTSTELRFRVFFTEDVDMDSAGILFAVDTDQNPATSGNYSRFNFYDVSDIGAEYDIAAIVPSVQPPGAPLFPALSLFVFNNNSASGAFTISSDAVSVDSNMIAFEVPLARLGGDDGNMDIAGFSTHIDYEATIISVDLLPNTGHVTVGRDPSADSDWLSVSPLSDALSLGETTTITAYFNSEGLEDNIVHTALILVEFTEPAGLVLDIPVKMTVGTPPVSVDDDGALNPLSYALLQNYPNPFNPQTTLKYSIPTQTDVSLVIYNLMGQEVMRWDEGSVPAGYHEKVWKGTTKTGVSLASGVYFYRLRAGDFVQTKKMVLLK